MKYMIRHEKLGIYQGSFNGFGFWYPSSDCPEFGLCGFDSVFDAKTFIEFLCSIECLARFDSNDFYIDDFDEILNIRVASMAAFCGPLMEVWSARR